MLAESVAGELIESEIEIRSGRGSDLRRRRGAPAGGAAPACSRWPRATALLLSATGTHPWSPWQEQRIIDTEHYQRVEDGLKYVAWRNNTFCLHVHVGVRGADRAIAVCDRLRPVLPELLALSANSPFLDGRDSGLHSARSQIFTKSFPRCGIPDAFGSLAAYADYVDFLRAHELDRRAHPAVVERAARTTASARWRCGSATPSPRAEESTALAALIAAASPRPRSTTTRAWTSRTRLGRLVEENLWRAIRHGLDGRMIDLERGEEFPAAAFADRLLAWTAPARAALGLEAALPSRERRPAPARALAEGASIGRSSPPRLPRRSGRYAGAEVRS